MSAPVLLLTLLVGVGMLAAAGLLVAALGRIQSATHPPRRAGDVQAAIRSGVDQRAPQTWDSDRACWPGGRAGS